MRHISPFAALALSVSLTAPLAPMKAQEALPVPEEDGFDLMEQGAQLLMRGILNEMAPALDELESMARELEPALEGFITEMGPAMTRLLAVIDDIDNYERPEILENGDIIIRRSPDAPRYDGPVGDEIEIDIEI